MKTVNIFTLGCKVNLFDSQVIATIFQKHGYRVCMNKDALDDAGIVVVNTCSVTGRADTKSR
ncbi:MAG: tRNA (N(6)-L-threonylcarbamoyladenosine(37)-C(2))-methylthiotransferase MtaB, partial [Thermodesulfobacteriota bacterium]